MKFYSLLIIILYSLQLNAQTNSDLLIFNSSGNIILNRGNKSLEKFRSESLLKKDVIRIIDGSITIINRNNKRVTINKPGTYKYKEISEKLELVETSLTNRYFVYVWDKMNKKDKLTSTAGGVVRGEDIVTSPSDSVYIISKSIKFSINNESSLKYPLRIMSDDSKLIRQYLINDILMIDLIDINDGKTGKYQWEIRVPYGNNPGIKCFFIPDKETRNKLLLEYKKNISEFSSFNNEIRSLLIIEYLKYNKMHNSTYCP